MNLMVSNNQALELYALCRVGHRGHPVAREAEGDLVRGRSLAGAARRARRASHRVERSPGARSPVPRGARRSSFDEHDDRLTHLVGARAARVARHSTSTMIA